MAATAEDTARVLHTNIDGVTHVHAYGFQHQAYTKGRWIGRQLEDVFNEEFIGAPTGHWKRVLAVPGIVRINNNIVNASTYVLRNGDWITHDTHRHEPPVKLNMNDICINIVYEDDELIVVDKPSSVPMHSGSTYHMNSLLMLLTKQLVLRDVSLIPHASDVNGDDTNDDISTIEQRDPSASSAVAIGRNNDVPPMLFCVHRLDRLTSGVVLIARSKKTANSVAQLIQAHDVRKFYLARVRGNYAATINRRLGVPTVAYVHDPAVPLPDEGSYKPCTAEFDEFDDALIISAAILKHPSGVAVRLLHPHGKEARTRIRCLGYDVSSDMSVLLCEPVTGRTHQIRLHVQLLGYPITNDPLYGGELELRPYIDSLVTPLDSDDNAVDLRPPSDHAVSLATLRQVCAICTSRSAETCTSDTIEADGTTPVVEDLTKSETETESDKITTSSESVPSKGIGASAVFTVAQLRCTCIYLHALRYESRTGGWAFEVDPAPWFPRDLNDALNSALNDRREELPLGRRKTY